MNDLEEYKAWYQENYKKRPSEKLIESYCKCNGLPWPPMKESPLKYSTYTGYCSKCGHDTEHEKIEDDSEDVIEMVTSCLVCGKTDVDIDPKMQWGEWDADGENEEPLCDNRSTKNVENKPD